MKKKITAFATLLMICVSAGCSGGTQQNNNDSGVFAVPFLPGSVQSSAVQEPGGTQLSGGIQTPTASSGYVGTWQHTYEYFDTQYHTTLVIDGNGTAAFYNDDAELGNFSASWYDTGSGISISRSDGVQSTAVIENGVLIETTYENGSYYQAEYYRA